MTCDRPGVVLAGGSGGGSGALRGPAGVNTLTNVTNGDEKVSKPFDPRLAARTADRRTNASRGQDDVLEQLAKIDDAPRPADSGALPPIVSADPSVPRPVTLPANARQATSSRADQGGPTFGTTMLVEAPVGSASTAPSEPLTFAVGQPSLLGDLSARPRSVVFARRVGRPRVRRVTRVVRHVDTWSVFKVALAFSAVLYLVCLVAGVLLWNVAYATGTINNVEKFFEQFGWSSFRFRGGEIFHNAWVGGLFIAFGLTGMVVLAATVFNLITDLVGGVRVSVLEEEVVARGADRQQDRA